MTYNHMAYEKNNVLIVLKKNNYIVSIWPQTTLTEFENESRDQRLCIYFSSLHVCGFIDETFHMIYKVCLCIFTFSVPTMHAFFFFEWSSMSSNVVMSSYGKKKSIKQDQCTNIHVIV